MASRLGEMGRVSPQVTGGMDATHVDVTEAQNHRAAGHDVLQLISTSISDDLGQKDKVEARQFSVLRMRQPPST